MSGMIDWVVSWQMEACRAVGATSGVGGGETGRTVGDC